MKKQSYERFVVMGITLLVLVTIFFAQDKLNFLAYSSALAANNVQPENAVQIMIDDGQQVTQLIKKDNVWFVKKNNSYYKSDQLRINNLLTSIANFKKDEVIVNNKDDHEKYGIGIHKVILTTDKDTFAIYIGKKTNLSRNYIRFGEDNDIYMAEGFNNIFNEEYRDMTINLVQNESFVNSISINNNGDITKLELHEGDWLINDKKVEKEKVSFYINDLKTIKLQEIPTSPSELTEANLIIEVTERNSTRKAVFFNQADEYFVKVTNHDEPLMIEQEDIESIKKTEEDFLL